MTVKELKDFANSISDDFDGNQIVIDGSSPSFGYNPVETLSIHPIDIVETFGENAGKGAEKAMVFRMS